MQAITEPAGALPISIADVEAAAARIAPRAVRTPLLTATALDARTGGRIFVKAECLQRTGSFKFRGAYNRLSMIPEGDRARGVVAMSSGNHAQGVAEAARLLGINATIVMPEDAPAVKLQRTARSGAKVVTYDRASVREDRVSVARRIVEESGATLVHPFDDPGVMAGQGTCGLEIVEELGAQGVVPDRILVCASGGGLISGIAVAVHEAFPEAIVQPVEPERFDDLSRSLSTGTLQSNESLSGSIADALLVQTPGEHTFKVLQQHAQPGYVVPDAALYPAMAFAFEELKLVTEPGGVIALAALTEGIAKVEGETVVAIISGGNVDPAMFADALARL